MAKAVQGWLHTIKFDEHYQTELKMSMTKLEPKRFYWFAAHLARCHCITSVLYQGENVPLSQIVLQCQSAQSIRDVLGTCDE